MNQNIRRLPLNALRTFASYGTHLHMVKAGEELGISGSAVSQQINRLEDLLNCELINRRAHKSSLTSSGAWLLKHINDSFDSLMYATQAIGSAKDSPILTIASVPGFYANMLIPRISDFLVRFPQYEINFRPISLFAAEISPEVDIAICFGKPLTGENQIKFYLESEYYPVCTQEYLRQHGKPKAAEDYINHCLIHTDNGGLWSNCLNNMGLEEVIACKNLYVQEGYDIAYKAVLNHMGIGLVNKLWVGNDLKSGKIIALGECHELGEESYYLVTSATKYKFPALQHFEEWLWDQREILKRL